jgi:phosphatidylinositol 4-kinase
MGGFDSDMFIYFKSLLIKGFMELRKHVDLIITLLLVMMDDSNLNCFMNFDDNLFRSRFLEGKTDKEVKII